jgi:hypothetical protein
VSHFAPHGLALPPRDTLEGRLQAYIANVESGHGSGQSILKMTHSASTFFVPL